MLIQVMKYIVMKFKWSSIKIMLMLILIGQQHLYALATSRDWVATQQYIQIET